VQLLPAERLALLAQAVRRHNHLPIVFFIKSNYTPLTQILVEADNIEAVSEIRFKRMFKENADSMLLTIIVKIHCWSTCFWYTKLPMSDYAKRLFSDILSKRQKPTKSSIPGPLLSSSHLNASSVYYYYDQNTVFKPSSDFGRWNYHSIEWSCSFETCSNVLACLSK